MHDNGNHLVSNSNMEPNIWKKLRQADVECFVLLDTSSDQCTCYLTTTDNVTIYSECLDLTTFKRRFDDLNCDLEINNVEDVLSIL